jgi:hypothetical protein
MEPPKEASVSYRDACERYIIDSGPKDDDVTTADVLDTAVAVGADMASLQDVYQDKDATVDALLDGLGVADDHRFAGGLLLPLQSPVVECWEEIGSPTDHTLGIGGLKDAPDTNRVSAARGLRAAVGDGVDIHGFGWGVRPDSLLTEAIRESPGLLDSLDYSTPLQNNVGDTTPGAERKSVLAASAGARLVRDLREVSPYPDGPNSEQTTAADYGII